MRAAGLALVACLCIWDRDTLDDELRGLPEAFTLLSGRWYRHGPAYYRSRLDTLPAQLEKNPGDLGAYDDLAVAHERIEQREQAIEVMRRKAESLKRRPDPDHLYRYHANLGTFYAHSGRFDEAVRELEEAVRINPSAHFGRERFQIDLIRYVAAAKKDPSLWTRHNGLTWAGHGLQLPHIAGQLYSSYTEVSPKAAPVDWGQAYTGIAGMLRFGGLEGGELYRILGDLHQERSELHLAWWAYRRAIERGHPAVEQIRKAAEGIEAHWREGDLTNVPTEQEFNAVRASADQWLANFHAAEEAALARGEDPGADAVLARLLAEADAQSPQPPFGRGTRRSAWLRAPLVVALGFLAVAVLAAFLAFVIARRRRPAIA